jgi:NADPH-dependent F420 reductase
LNLGIGFWNWFWQTFLEESFSFMSTDKPSIAIVGGTGDLGSGLALRWAQAGYAVIIGSRDAARAATAASELNAKIGSDKISGQGNADAAASGEVVVLTVPFANHQPTLEMIKDNVGGKIVVDVTVPLMPPKVRTVHIPEAGSAAKAAQIFLGEEVKVVSAFQNVAAAHLADLAHAIDCDILVCGNDPAARDMVVSLAEAAGMTAWQAGRIDNSVVAEALTSALIFMNNKYKIAGAGIKITGKPGSAGPAGSAD